MSRYKVVDDYCDDLPVDTIITDREIKPGCGYDCDGCLGTFRDGYCLRKMINGSIIKEV